MAARLTAVRRDLPPVLSADRVSFQRGSRTVLRDVSLEVFPHERIGLVGPSGAGKTTLLRLLAGLERPADGQIRPALVAGERDRSDGVRVGLLFQDLGLFPHMRVLGNVAFPLLARRVPRGERRRRAQQALEQAGLGGYGDRFPASLSGGERQRVALVRTLLSEPAVVLLDEPFASLDPHLIDHFAEWLEEMQSSTGIPMVLVTHDVSFALRWSDRLAVLLDGAVTQLGPPGEVYDRPRTEFVATFLGRANVLDAFVETAGDNGTVRCKVPSESSGPVSATTAAPALAAGTSCRLVLRPHHLDLVDAATAASGSALAGTVVGVEFAGPNTDVLLTTGAGTKLRVSAKVGEPVPAVGDPAAVRWPPRTAHAVAP